MSKQQVIDKYGFFGNYNFIKEGRQQQVDEDRVKDLISFAVAENFSFILIDYNKKVLYECCCDEDLNVQLGISTSRKMRAVHHLFIDKDDCGFDLNVLQKFNSIILDYAFTDKDDNDGFYYFRFALEGRITDVQIDAIPFSFTSGKQLAKMLYVIRPCFRQKDSRLSLVTKTDRYIYDDKEGRFISAYCIHISDDEVEMLRLSGEGYTEAEIIEKISFTPSAFKKAKILLFEKLKVNSVSKALREVYRLGLLDRPSIECLSLPPTPDLSFKDERVCNLIRFAFLLGEAENMAILLTDSQSNVIYASKTFLHLINYDGAGDLNDIGSFFREHIYERDLSTLDAVTSYAAQIAKSSFRVDNNKQYVVAYNFRIVKELNSLLWLNALSRPVLFNQDDNPDVYLNMFKPVSTVGINRFSIRILANGNTYIYSDRKRAFTLEDKYQLKEVEIDIIQLTADGCTEQKVISRLNITIGLLKHYKKSIFHKMNVHSMNEVVYIALECGLIH